MKTIDQIARARRQLELELRAVEEIRDLVRVQIHLGGMEIKDAWQGLQPQIFSARRRAEEGLANLGVAITQDVIDTVSSVRIAMDELRERLHTSRRN